MTCAEIQELLAAYSLDALDEREREVVAGHLERCPPCGTDLPEYEMIAGGLGLAVEQQEPPADLRGRILAAAARDAGAPAHPGKGLLRLPRPRPVAVVAALALVVALSAALWAAGLQMELGEQRAAIATLRERASRFDRVVTVLQAPDLRVRALAGTDAAPSGMGRVYVDPHTGAGMLTVRALPPLPSGRAYQLWWVRPDGKRESGGLLTWTDQGGNGYVLVQCPVPCTSFEAAGVTEEPTGGSPAPTGQRLLAAAPH